MIFHLIYNTKINKLNQPAGSLNEWWIQYQPSMWHLSTHNFILPTNNTNILPHKLNEKNNKSSETGRIHGNTWKEKITYQENHISYLTLLFVTSHVNNVKKLNFYLVISYIFVGTCCCNFNIILRSISWN